MKKAMLFPLTVLCLGAFAQHPFYTRIYEDGLVAAERQRWDEAAEFLEIAAFGLLEHPGYLADIYCRLTVIEQSRDQPEKADAFQRKAERILRKNPGKPERLQEDVWRLYLDHSGRRAPDPPPVPSGFDALNDYVQKHPGLLQGWLALVDAGDQRPTPEMRAWFERGLKQHPRSDALLEKALLFSVRKDNGRQSGALAERLLAVKPDASLAHEALAHLALDEAQLKRAKDHFDRVQTPQLPGTGQKLRRLQRALNKAAEEAEAAARKAAQVEDEASPPRQEPTPAPPLNEEAAAKTRGSQENGVDAGLNIEFLSRAVEASSRVSKKTANADLKQDQAARRDRNATTKQSRAASTTTIAEEMPINHPQTDDEMLRELELKVRKSPGDTQAKLTLAQLYLDRKQLSKVRRLIKKLNSQDIAHKRYAEIFGQYHYARGDYETNAVNLSLMNNMTPKANYYLGLSLLKLDQRDTAKKYLQKLTGEAFPYLKQIAPGLGLTLAVKPDRSDRPATSALADDQPSQLEQLSAKFQDRQIGLAEQIELIELLAAEEKWSQARPVITNAFERYSDNADVNFFMGRLFLADGLYEQASRQFFDLVKTGYRERGIFYFGGLAFKQKGDDSIADYLFNHAEMQGSPYSREIRHLRGKGESKKLKKVTNYSLSQHIEKLERRIRKQQNDVASHMALLRLYSVTGRYRDYSSLNLAVKRLEKDMTKEQQDIIFGWELLNNNMVTNAIPLLDRYNSEEAVFLTGFALLSLGKSEEADNLLKPLSRNNRFPEVAALLKAE